LKSSSQLKAIRHLNRQHARAIFDFFEKGLTAPANHGFMETVVVAIPQSTYQKDFWAHFVGECCMAEGRSGKYIVSRRKLIAGGFAVAASGVFYKLLSKDAFIRSDTDSLAGLTLVHLSSDHPDIDSLTLLPNLPLNLRGSDPVQSAVLVSSKNTQAVKACSIRWKITKLDESEISAVYGFMSRPRDLTKFLATGEQSLICKDQTCLVSPFFWKAPSEFSSTDNLTDANFMPPSHDDRGRGLVSDLSNAVRISAEFDAVITGNEKENVVYGDDAAGLSRKFAVIRSAERDEAAALLSEISDHSSLLAAHQLIASHVSSAKMRSTRLSAEQLVNQEERHYWIARGRYARSLGEYLTRTMDAGSYRAFLSQVSESPTTVTRG
jgi:hypothetical protein